ncbi:MAG TPA: gamma-glutamyltransferase family protein [Thermodesulfobacteriota bacterium]
MRQGTVAERARPSDRPTVVGRHQAASTGHYLATVAAMRVLDRGGNAVDAGVTASMALAVLQPDIVSFAGVAPTLIYLARESRVVSLAGLGYWPAATDVARLAAVGGASVPEGILRTVVPAAPATHIEALRRFGTISFEEAATPALELARDGFAMYPLLAAGIERNKARLDRYPENARIFRPGGRTPAVGEIFRQPDLARTIERLIDAERHARGDRDARLAAVHDAFYRGPIAEAIVAFHEREEGFLAAADLAGFTCPVEDSIRVSWRGLEVHACDVWCQGITLLEALAILDGFDLAALGHNSPAYIHTVAEALNLAFADREAYVGDPAFVDVPVAGLLSADYAARQRARIDPRRAFGRMPDPGSPPGAGRAGGALPGRPGGRRAAPASPDTIYGCVVDRHGNAYSATLSDSAFDTPIVPGTGLSVSSRGSQSRLDPNHPASVRPGKRPRLTPTPGLVLRDGRFHLAVGTPGGDIQCQAMLQVLLNLHVFGMAVQQAVEAPRFGTFSFPNSFAPHDYAPGRLYLEAEIPAETASALAALGHDVQRWPVQPWTSGGVCAVLRDPATGLLHAGADPRREAYALAW